MVRLEALVGMHNSHAKELKEAEAEESLGADRVHTEELMGHSSLLVEGKALRAGTNVQFHSDGVMFGSRYLFVCHDPWKMESAATHACVGRALLPCTRGGTTGRSLKKCHNVAAHLTLRGAFLSSRPHPHGVTSGNQPRRSRDIIAARKQRRDVDGNRKNARFGNRV